MIFVTRVMKSINHKSVINTKRATSAPTTAVQRVNCLYLKGKHTAQNLLATLAYEKVFKNYHIFLEVKNQFVLQENITYGK